MLVLKTLPCCDNGAKQSPGKGGLHGKTNFDEKNLYLYFQDSTEFMEPKEKEVRRYSF